MKYIIDDVVIFDNDQSTLTNTNTHDSVSLTMTQTIILDYILKSNGEVLSKDNIIDLFWHQHGITCSSHTFNQYVSVLRRNFDNLGIQNIIISVPRLGVKINPDITVSEFSDVSDIAPAVIYFAKPIYFKLITSFMVFIIALVIALLLYCNSIEEKFHYNMIGGTCNIGLSFSFSEKDRSQILDYAYKLIKRNNLSCGKDRVFFFDFYKTGGNDDFGRVLLAKCIKGSLNDLISCDNYYYKELGVK